MNGILVNYSNHPSEKWSPEQMRAAQVYGAVVDVPFAQVEADLDEAGLSRLADEETSRILAYFPRAVLCQGEMTLTYAVVRRLREKGITVLAACSDRISTEAVDEAGNTVRRSVFVFTRMRSYE